MTKAPNIKAALEIPKNSLTGSFLVANAFVWYVCAFSFLQYLSKSNGYGLLPVVTVNLATLIISAFAVSLITGRFKNSITFLKYWTGIGVLLSLLFAVLNTTDFSSLLALSAVVGVYFGFGMPTCTAYFAQQTQPQNRAKASGLIILILGVGYAAITLLDANPILIAAVLAAWRITSLLPILRSKTPQEDTEVKQKVTYRSIFQSRAFLLYTVPWLMFSLINDLTMELNNAYFNSGLFPAAFAQNYMLIENVLAGASAIICGVLADKNGRKRIALVAFVLLGIGYASLGLFSGLYVAALFYVCVDGFAWGAFMMLFLFTVWGDIAQERGAEKFYFLGVLPYLFSNFIRVGFGQPIASEIGTVTVVFSFASFFLFLAILPLAYAPETLPEKLMKKAELDNYIEKALLKVQKENSA
jgi:MFS family permease